MSELIGYFVFVLLCDSQQTAAVNFHFHPLSQVLLCLLHGLCLAQFKHYTAPEKNADGPFFIIF